MKTAVILHSVSDARHCVKNKLYEGNMLFSTHSSVDVYLKEKHGLDCQCLSKFMPMEELIKERSALSEKADSLLKDLDSGVSPLLNSRFNLKVDYFTPLYSHSGKYHLLGYVSFVNCVKKITDLYKLEKISFYYYRFDKRLNVSTDIGDLVSGFFKDIKTEIIKTPADDDITRPETGPGMLVNKLKRLLKYNMELIHVKAMAALRKYKFRKFSDDKRTILISEPLYDLEFLPAQLRRFNILYYDFRKEIFLGFKKERSAHKIDPDAYRNVRINDVADPFMKIFLKDIKEDLKRNINRYLSIIYSIENINKKYPVSVGIWGVAPAWEARAMIFEYLRSIGVKSIGSQHGCLYGEVFSLWQFDSDFNRCDYFISWGFTKEDLKNIYTSKNIDLEILPFGKVKIAKSLEAVKNIDLLFPITNSISLFEGGTDRLSPDKLTERQIALLKYLNSLDQLKICVKPFVNSNYQNCSVMPVLEKLKNLKVAGDISLTDFLKKTMPAAVLIEFPSQPLFDVLPLDTEIFLMDDPVNPYVKKALEELKKRVHYCENIDEVVSKLDLFLKGKLEKKRDKTFYEHYLYKENTEEKIAGLVTGLAEKG